MIIYHKIVKKKFYSKDKAYNNIKYIMQHVNYFIDYLDLEELKLNAIQNHYSEKIEHS